MTKKNRSTLKRYFSEGALPSEDHFGDLIDSTLNTIDEGFDKSPEHGFEISLIGDHDRLISFLRDSAAKHPAWAICYEKEQDRLKFVKADESSQSVPVLTLNPNNRVGINTGRPNYTLDVAGVIGAHGRIGANPNNQTTVPADGQWHDITGVLTGCQAFEIMAGAGNKGTGKYALMNALAINTYNPTGFMFNFLNLKKRIKYHQAYYLSRGNKIKLRWVGKGHEYRLQMRTNCEYGNGTQIRYYVTQLWFDEYMHASIAPGDVASNQQELDADNEV